MLVTILCFVDRASLYNLFEMKPTRCTLLLSIFISTSVHVLGNYVPILRITYCICATLVFLTLCGWLSGLHRPDSHPYRTKNVITLPVPVTVTNWRDNNYSVKQTSRFLSSGAGVVLSANGNCKRCAWRHVSAVRYARFVTSRAAVV